MVGAEEVQPLIGPSYYVIDELLRCQNLLNYLCTLTYNTPILLRSFAHCSLYGLDIVYHKELNRLEMLANKKR